MVEISPPVIAPTASSADEVRPEEASPDQVLPDKD